MPELPEVETTRRGVRPHVIGRVIRAVAVRERRLRWPLPRGFERRLVGARVLDVERRAKYLLFRLARGEGSSSSDAGTLLVHLGMSGSLRILSASEPAGPHDHVDLVLDGGRQGEEPRLLRLRDPRRFGCMLFTSDDPRRHALLRELGPEPLSSSFDGGHLAEAARGRRAPVKAFLMDSAVVVGVGNIYANESLWRAGIHPRRPAGRVGAARYDALAKAVKETLAAAIERGGTTLRDFLSADGEPGYFRLELSTYDRRGAPCPRCSAPIRSARVGQRSSFFCPRCQR
jgi:formamidopyrimidine-DNA glycosylase